MPITVLISHTPSGGRWSWEGIGRGCGLLLFVLLVVGPLATLITAAGQSLIVGETEWLSLVLPAERRGLLLLRSLSLGSVIAIIGMALGTVVAVFLWCQRSPPWTYVRWLVWALAPLPPYVNALSWSAAAGWVNDWPRSVGLPTVSVEGLWAAVWVELMAVFPIAIGFALIALESVDRLTIEAARVQRPDLDVLMRVILPLASPMLAAGAGILFLFSLADYSVPSLFGVTVYPLEIFAEFSASHDSARALAVSIPMLLVGAVVVAAFQVPLRAAVQRPTYSDWPWPITPHWPRWFVAVQRAALAMFIFQGGVLLISQATAIGSLQRVATTLSAASSEIGVSFWVGAAAAILCLLPAVAVADELLRAGGRSRLWWILVTGPLAVPAPLVGIGLITLWNRPFGADLYGSELILVLAGSARFAPVTVLLVLAQLRRIDPLLLDAARIVQTSAARTLLFIKLPLLAPGLLAAVGITFVLTVGELGATLIVAPPGYATLTMRIYNFLHYGALGEVAVLCLMMTAITVMAGLLAVATATLWSILVSAPGRYR